MIPENIFVLIAIVGAIAWAKDKRLPVTIFLLTSSIIAHDLLFSYIGGEENSDLYYLTACIPITIAFCYCVVFIVTRIAFWYALCLTVYSLLTAIMILDIVYLDLIYGSVGDIMVLVDVIAAWCAAERSRKG